MLVEICDREGIPFEMAHQYLEAMVQGDESPAFVLSQIRRYDLDKDPQIPQSDEARIEQQ